MGAAFAIKRSTKVDIVRNATIAGLELLVSNTVAGEKLIVSVTYKDGTTAMWPAPDSASVVLDKGTPQERTLNGSFAYTEDVTVGDTVSAGWVAPGRFAIAKGDVDLLAGTTTSKEEPVF